MLNIDSVSFDYDAHQVLRDVSFTVSAGEVVALIGESGCGKSTMLKLIYGQMDVGSGSITYNGTEVPGPKHKLIPGEDQFKYLAQDFGLMPYSTVAENVGSFLSNVDKAAKHSRVIELLQTVGMEEHAQRKVQFLSGGQQQRVALAKALAHEPELLLLDEPFSQIDTFRINSLRRNLFRFLRQKNIACVIATHDANDVLSYADQVIVLKSGAVVEAGHPKDVYRNTNSFYVASLFGEVNRIPAKAFSPLSQDDEFRLVYPHQLRRSERGFQVTVKANFFRGSHYLVEAVSAWGIVYFEDRTPCLEGTVVTLSLSQ